MPETKCGTPAGLEAAPHRGGKPFSQALKAQVAQLRTEAGILRAYLASALCEAERLAAAACKHPAGAIDGSTCRACGAEIW